MKKLLNIFIVFLLGFVFFGGVGEVFAQECLTVLEGLPVILPAYEPGISHTMHFDFTGMLARNDYIIKIKDSENVEGPWDKFQTSTFAIPSNSSGSNGAGSWIIEDYKLTLTITSKKAFTPPFNSDNDIFSHTAYVKLYTYGFPDLKGICQIGQYTTTAENKQTGQCNITVKQSREGFPNGCFAPGCLAFKKDTFLSEADSQDPITITITGLEKDGVLFNGSTKVITHNNPTYEGPDAYQNFVNGAVSFPFTAYSASQQTIRLDGIFSECRSSFSVLPSCPDDENSCSAEGSISEGEYKADQPFSLCKQIPDGPLFATQRQECYDCTGGDEEKENNQGVWTAIGCINRDPQSIMQSLISVGLGMSGGVALLTFLAAGFIFSTSQGDPKAYGKAKEMMTAAIVGIIFVIFSVTLLQFVGYEIFKIPGFGG